MKIRMGYVGKNHTLDITTSSTVTLSYYNRIGSKKGIEKIKKVGLKNLNSLKEVLAFNLANGIHFYRITSNLIPLVDIDSIDLNLDYFKKELREIGAFIKKHKMRVDAHPDQFCVLNSTEPHVIENSIRILKYHAELFDLMDYDGKIVLHVGSGKNGKKESLNRFKINFQFLDKTIQKKIILENDDRVFSMLNVLKLCEDIGVPMVLDFHHHRCLKSGSKIEDYLERICATWSNAGFVPKMHYSSPRDKKNKRAHHDYIDCHEFMKFIEKLSFVNFDIDIMLEAKQKDEALFRLSHQLKHYSYYNFSNDSSFEL